MEKRKQRKNCKVYMKVFHNERDDLIGYLVNITTDGLMLTSEAPIETNALLQLRVILPEEIMGNKEVTLTAMSRWCDQEEDPPLYNTGFQLQDPPKEHIRIIEKLIKKFCFKS